MVALIYIIKTVLISGLLLSYYWLFLRNRFFHEFNRFFLISIPVISFLLPSLHFNVADFRNSSASGSPIRLLGVTQGKLEDAFSVYGTVSHSTHHFRVYMLAMISILVTIMLFIRFYKSIRFLHQLRKDKPVLRIPDANIYFVSVKGTPFSFFKSIFWGRELDLNSVSGRQILKHELFHVKQKHSVDMLFLEIFSMLNWFNPFLYFMRRELKAIHEYSADAYALTETDHYNYAGLLLLHVSGSSLPFTNPFFKNQIKRRITMITKTKKSKNALLGRIMILPLITVLICMFSFKLQNRPYLLANKTLKVVIDAGHGGVDPGTMMNGIPEKNINLQIAKKIQELSPVYQVEVIMTREKDLLPGNGENIQNALKYRAELPEKVKADLFISIHTNSTGKNVLQEIYSGFDIYLPVNSSKVYVSSVKLGSIIAENIKPDYTIAPELKQGKGRILVLDNASVPSILIECGYMDNKADLAYLQDEMNQEKIARDILEGIQKYGRSNAE